ncbi:hypothetical protein PR048_020679 [Dryococelus australis]|uniref:Uncharacterized protein n=1 Tax=Dryococelus australis TaxID=614101 RepID=A0ABQ9H745_9NEOP|nr:hypothetical protein PR048_020679 [Dryococelus australis]
MAPRGIPASKVKKRGSDTGDNNTPERSYVQGVQCFHRDAVLYTELYSPSGSTAVAPLSVLNYTLLVGVQQWLLSTRAELYSPSGSTAVAPLRVLNYTLLVGVQPWLLSACAELYSPSGNELAPHPRTRGEMLCSVYWIAVSVLTLCVHCLLDRLYSRTATLRRQVVSYGSRPVRSHLCCGSGTLATFAAEPSLAPDIYNVLTCAVSGNQTETTTRMMCGRSPRRRSSWTDSKAGDSILITQSKGHIAIVPSVWAGHPRGAGRGTSKASLSLRRCRRDERRLLPLTFLTETAWSPRHSQRMRIHVTLQSGVRLEITGHAISNANHATHGILRLTALTASRHAGNKIIEHLLRNLVVFVRQTNQPWLPRRGDVIPPPPRNTKPKHIPSMPGVAEHRWLIQESDITFQIANKLAGAVVMRGCLQSDTSPFTNMLSVVLCCEHRLAKTATTVRVVSARWACTAKQSGAINKGAEMWQPKLAALLATSYPPPSSNPTLVTTSQPLPHLLTAPKLEVGNVGQRFGRLVSIWISESMRLIKVSIEQRRNERAGEVGDPRENPPISGIVRHDYHMRKSGNQKNKNEEKISSMTCELVSPVSLPRYLTLDAQLHSSLKYKYEGCAPQPSLSIRHCSLYREQRIADGVLHAGLLAATGRGSQCGEGGGEAGRGMLHTRAFSGADKCPRKKRLLVVKNRGGGGKLLICGRGLPAQTHARQAPPHRQHAQLTHTPHHVFNVVATRNPTVPRTTHTLNCRPSNSLVRNMGRDGRAVGSLTFRQGDPGSIPAGSPDLRVWESCRTMPLVIGFSRESPVSPAPSFRHCSLLTSIALIGSEDISVKSRPNLFTYSSLLRNISPFALTLLVYSLMYSPLKYPPAFYKNSVAESEAIVAVSGGEAQSIKDDTNTRIKCAIATKREVLSWRSVVLRIRMGRDMHNSLHAAADKMPLSLALTEHPSTTVMYLAAAACHSHISPAYSVPGPAPPATWAADEGEIEVNTERAGMKGGGGGTGDPRENPPTNGIDRHDSHLRKSGDPAED